MTFEGNIWECCHLKFFIEVIGIYVEVVGELILFYGCFEYLLTIFTRWIFFIGLVRIFLS